MQKILFIIVDILLVALLLSLHTCNQKEKEAENWKAKSVYQAAQIDSFKNSKGIQVVEQKVAETNDAKEIKKISADIFDLKKSLERQIKLVTALVRVTQEAKIADSFIEFEPAPPHPKDSALINPDSVIIPPMKFSHFTDNYSIDGVVELKGVRINSLIIPNTISFRIAEKKEGFFKPRQTVVQAINSNPLYVNKGAQSIVLKQKTSAWNKVIKPALFFAAGSFITSKLKR